MMPNEVMVDAATKWLADDPARDPQFSDSKAMPGVIFSDNGDADEINDVMVGAAETAGFYVSGVEVDRAICQVVTARMNTSPHETPERGK